MFCILRSLNQRQNSFIQSKGRVCFSLMSFCNVNKIVFISTTLKAYSAVCWKTYIHVRWGANRATVLKDSACRESINESVHTHPLLPSALSGLFIFYRPLRMHELLSQAKRECEGELLSKSWPFIASALLLTGSSMSCSLG